MALVRPFKALRPNLQYTEDVMAPPYDVMNREEAFIMASKKIHSFLHITRAEIDLPISLGPYHEKVYLKAKENLKAFIDEGILTQDPKACFYLYRQEMEGRIQTGLVCTVSVQEYLLGRIKRHELTRTEKEEDRLKHFSYTQAHTEPVFLTYRHRTELSKIIADEIDKSQPLFKVKSEDGVLHSLYMVVEEGIISDIIEEFQKIPSLYIADGHHRCQSAARLGLEEKAKRKGREGEYDFFLAVLFPENELKIFDYNRLIKDINGYEKEEFLNAIREKAFNLKGPFKKAVRPIKKHTFGMYLKEAWYLLEAESDILKGDLSDLMDVTILQERILGPLLSIEDPRKDRRIDFVGGTRGLEELEKRCREDMEIAFSLYPVGIDELLEISDQGRIMPPKSTWFEPKLLSGLFIHMF